MVAEKIDIRQHQISEWKKQLLEQADIVFGSAEEHKSANESRLKELYAKIGERALENNILAKALGR